MNQIRLLIVTTIPSTISGFLLPFIRHFRAKGWTIDAMTGKSSSIDETWKKDFNRVLEVEWSRNPLDPRNFLRTPRNIRKYIEEGCYDIVHVHTPIAAFITRISLRTFRKKKRKPKVIYTAHGFHFHSGGSIITNTLFICMEKLAGWWTDHLVVINHEDEEFAKKYRLVDKENLFYMPGIGVDTAYLDPSMDLELEINDVRRAMGISPDTPLVMMIAEFIPRKRHKDALDAFAKLRLKDAHLAFAGTGPLMGKMIKYAEEKGISHRVSFLGWRNDIQTLIRASVVTILPSEREGLPRSIMESLCLETPVIAPDVRGVRELLGNGLGIMVQVGDVDAISEAISWVIDNPEKAREVGRRGRLRMIKEYDIRRIIRMHEELYSVGS